jgi:hypothetical protein
MEVFDESCILPEVLSAWAGSCETLVSMQALAELTVTFRAKYRKSPHCMIPLATLLDPLRQVKASKFMINVPPNGDPESVIDGMDEVPFTVVPKASLKTKNDWYNCWGRF